MPNVVLQQVSSDYAKHNAARSLDKPVALKYLTRYFTPEEYDELLAKYDNDAVYIWGAKLERHHQIHKMLPRQTLVLFRKGQSINRCAVIQNIYVNVELAERLWGLDDDGETWGIVFIMPKIINIKITASEVNEVIGRKQTDNWQGMTSVNGEKAEKLIEYVKSHIKTL